MNRDRRPTFDRIRGQVGACSVKKSEATGPPFASCIDICSGAEKDVEHRPAADLRDYGRVERTNWVVDAGLQFRMVIEEAAHARRIVSMEGLHRLAEDAGRDFGSHDVHSI